MKFRNKLLFPVVLLTVLTACKKSFLDVNTNPNAVIDVPAKTLLPNTTVSIAFVNSNELGKVAGLLMQYNSGVLGNAAQYDVWNIGSLDNSWSFELYTNTV